MWDSKPVATLWIPRLLPPLLIINMQTSFVFNIWDHVGVCGRLLSMTCVGVLESGNLASIFAVTGHGFSLVPSLMYIFRGLLFLSNRNLSVLPPTFNTRN